MNGVLKKLILHLKAIDSDDIALFNNIDLDEASKSMLSDEEQEMVFGKDEE